MAGAQVNFLSLPWSTSGFLRNLWASDETGRPRFQAVAAAISHRRNVTVIDHEAVSEDMGAPLIPLLQHFNVRHVFTSGALIAVPRIDPFRAVSDSSLPFDLRPKAWRAINVHPLPFIPCRNVPPATEKDVSFSFVGSARSSPSRIAFARKLRGFANEIVHNSFPHDVPDWIRRTREAEHDRLLARSVFSLCPAGSVPNTIRIWEALAARTIPVVIADKWVAPPWRWSDCVIQIRETEFAG